ncbi:MAG: ribosomal L7Ae/L30e/S12e/Gadd45 family protein [Clostridia bacterium]|nr:ribosomal L7Ae/L30e/S12e/Gadd45 family protein [Clostridia bacterium]
MNDKILTLLGFAAKAGKLSYGFDTTVTAIKKGKSGLVLTACDISEKSKKEIEFFATQRTVPYIVLKDTDIEALSKAVGRKCGIVSVNDSGFADACRKAYF